MDKKYSAGMYKELGTINSYLKDLSIIVSRNHNEVTGQQTQNHLQLIKHIEYQTTKVEKTTRAISHTNRILSTIVPTMNIDNQPILTTPSNQFDFDAFAATHTTNQKELYDLVKRIENKDFTSSTSSTIDDSSISGVTEGMSSMASGIMSFSTALMTLGLNSAKVLPFIGGDKPHI